MAKKHKGFAARKGARPPKAPPMGAGGSSMPGPNEFDAGQEQAMRQGQRQANMPAPAPDGDDIGGLGGM